jgi:hypothetical protein
MPGLSLTGADCCALRSPRLPDGNHKAGVGVGGPDAPLTAALDAGPSAASRRRRPGSTDVSAWMA